MSTMEQYLNEHLSDAGKSFLGKSEIYSFLECFLLCHLYGASFKALFDPHFSGLYVKPTMSHERLYEIINAARQNRREDHEIFTMDIALKRMYQFFGFRSRELFSARDGGVVSIDDDKVQLRSSSVPESEGLQSVYQSIQSPGPTIMSA